MAGRGVLIVAAAASAALVVPGAALAAPETSRVVPAGQCSAGARTLSAPGSRLYPDTGNGGYTSAIMNLQQNITRFESQFTGPYPFTSDGVVIGTPPASFEEEMQTMITFAGGFINTDVLYHENMHQWWGDNVTEGSYQMTFFKEGMATLAEFLYAARLAEKAAGGPHTSKGRQAFEASLVHQFAAIYHSGKTFWTVAPSNPAPVGLFSGASTYARPGGAYIALRQILGHGNFDRALRQIQRRYGGGSITEMQLEAGFGRWLPVRGAACRARLGQFFSQWFDTAYPAGGGSHRPRITGPGLAGAGFYRPGGGCA